jgi:hypothetical protein
MKPFESHLFAFLSALRLTCFNLYSLHQKHYKPIKTQLQRLKMNIYSYDYDNHFKNEEYCLLQVENIFYDDIYEHRHQIEIRDTFYITIPLEDINSTVFYFYYPLSEKQKNKIKNFIINKKTT